MQKSYRVTGMHCTACIQKITAALNKEIKKVQVTLRPPRIVLEDDALPELKKLNELVSKAGAYVFHEETEALQVDTTYYPLFLIVSLIALASFAGIQHWHDWMRHFMAGFFIVFSFFKLLDIHGFKDAYATYDVLAKKWNAYGYVYPFLELLLGFLFLFQIQLQNAFYFSMMLMGFSSLGVIQALRSKQNIRCACLGTVINLPMSTITLVEDVGMAVMAVIMLVS